MKVLVTGSSGWLGRYLMPMLRTAGHCPIGLDVMPGEHTDIVGTVADIAIIEKAFTEHSIEAVIHAAALHKPDIARHGEKEFVDVNIAGTLNLLTIAAAAGHDRFVFTSTTSLMISEAVRAERGVAAVWLDETSGPLAPRNIYGVTKLAAEGLCRLYARERNLPCVILRTARFFPEEDDTLTELSGPNLKANEFLHRRLTVEDAAAAHIAALERAPDVGFDISIVSAPTPFDRSDCEALKSNAEDVVARYFPDAPILYEREGWKLPTSIARVYDARHAETTLGFRCRTSFADILEALRAELPMPFAHRPDYVSPMVAAGMSD